MVKYIVKIIGYWPNEFYLYLNKIFSYYKRTMSDIHVPLMTKLKTNKPKLAQTTLDAYHSSLRILYKNVTGNDAKSVSDLYKLFFSKTGMRKVMSALQKVKYSLRKARLASILALCENGTKNEEDICEVYREMMLKDIQTHNEQSESQEKTETQEKHWKSMQELKEEYEKLKQEALPLLKRKASEIKRKEYDTLQKYVMASLYILQSPRRIKDYQLLVWKKDDELNWIDWDKRQFVFNAYKTTKTYGTQRVDIDSEELLKILKLWEKKKKALRIKSDFVFSDRDGKAFTQPSFTKELNSIFGKGISASMIRHIYLSDKFENMPAIRELKETAEELGHSTNQLLQYIKKD